MRSAPRISFALAMGCTALMAATAAMAQPQMASRSVAPQVSSFVSAVGPTRADREAGRFEDPICPAAWGLAPEQNRAVARRVRAVAAAAGMEVAAEGCHTNALVVVTENKSAFVRGLAQELPSAFGSLSPTDVRRLAETSGPTASWQSIGWVDPAGIRLPSGGAMPMGVSSGKVSPVSRGGPVAVDGTGLPTHLTTEPLSRIRPSARPIFESAVVLVERRALNGLSMTQVADYAAMRLLTKLEPQRVDRGTPTILRAIEAPMGSAVPVTLTEWDLAFLRGLRSN